jgi:hypothetical protein
LQDHSIENNNCYHFAVNGVWEKEIYNSDASYGTDVMTPEEFTDVLANYFTEVGSNSAIYGETIITMNYSGGVPQHSAVYAGTDRKGNVYALEKYGPSVQPQLINLTKKYEENYYKFRFYNEK